MRGGIVYDEWEWTTELLQEMGDRPCIRISETPAPGLTHGYIIFPDASYTRPARNAFDIFYSEIPQDVLEGLFPRPRQLIAGGWPH